jgi:lipopolysaccharide transport system ATP-binding protein
MSDIAIRVEAISKYYRIGEREPYKMLRDVLVRSLSTQVRSMASRLVGRGEAVNGEQSKNDFWALKDVSFEVREGEALGIIGRNGAGKSTLLKILSRITLPTRGRAQMYGRLASLLEVGTGFHPELTGRDNIYLNGAILGMKRTEIERKFDEIVSFAEVERFIDTPVKHYSSGMYLRLAFAVAAHLEPEILLIDEILAVGDAAFQKKCLGKMDEVARAGRTVLFVSHNIAAIQQLTHNSILLDAGKLVAHGPSGEVINQYLSTVTNQRSSTYDLEQMPRRYPELRREVEFISAELNDYPNRLVPSDADICLRITVRGNENVDRFRFSLTIFQVDGRPVGNVFGPEVHSIQKGEVATFGMELTDLRLARGMYYCALACGTGNHLEDRTEFDIVVDVLYFEVMGPATSDGVMSEWLSVWGPVRFREPRVSRIN